jgi:hypothetical protein
MVEIDEFHLVSGTCQLHVQDRRSPLRVEFAFLVGTAVTKVSVVSKLIGFILGLMIFLVGVDAALADKRVALLIGNSNYSTVNRLPNPANDVMAMKAAFEADDFDRVDVALDVSREGMIKSLRVFEDEAAGADVAVVYYSGHGIEMGGENYLIPIDAQLASDRDVIDETVPLDRVLQTLDGASRLKLVILDACRTNPFLAHITHRDGSRAIDRGLARVDPPLGNMLVAFAAKAGTVALDGDGHNSPFTASLAKHLIEPGVDIRLALGEVRDDVLDSTGRVQEPFLYGSLGGTLIALPKATLPPSPTTPSARVYPFARTVSLYPVAYWDEKAQITSSLYQSEAASLDEKGVGYIRLDQKTACFAGFMTVDDQGGMEAYVLNGGDPGDSASIPASMPIHYALAGTGKCTFNQKTLVDTCEGKNPSGSTDIGYFRYPTNDPMNLVPFPTLDDAVKSQVNQTPSNTIKMVDCSAYRDKLMSMVDRSTPATQTDPAAPLIGWIEENLLLDGANASQFQAVVDPNK